MQQQLGADHELGKSYTALGLGLLGTGDLAGCGAALDLATEILDRCGYRSGRARAELARALWHARSGRLDEARTSATWAVSELEEAEVYPTLIMTAGAILDLIGQPDERVSCSVRQARTRVQPLHGMDRLDSAIGAMVSRLVADRWEEIYARAHEADQAANGFYHRNVRVGQYLVREPIPGAETMDLHIWPEPIVLSVVARHVNVVPRLHAISHRPAYQIHEWINGAVLNDVAPRGVRLPDGFIEAAIGLFSGLEHVPLAELPPPPQGWPADGDCAGFAQTLLSVRGCP